MKNSSERNAGPAKRAVKKLEDASLKKVKGGNIKGGHKQPANSVSTKPIS